ncbi:MAG: helix-turn-helix domain-containing protein [Chitinophagaceae bacterium]|nr:helix-turn-helix domain-containing protein [Chitinophagaceae bacterium]MCW5926774.1 helix-turn-helix domain-containing protein [Chitinophagaceae bacterium]
MKLVNTKITPLINSFLHVELREQPFLYSPHHGQATFHAHPELELTYVLEGYGNRIIGNNVSPFADGDMVFIGSNVPHIWMSDPVYYQDDSLLNTKVVVAYINPTIFEQMFELLAEFEPIKEMIRIASGGLHIFGETQRVVGRKLLRMIHASGVSRIEGFLNILHILAESREKELISDNKTSIAIRTNSDRLVPVLQYIKENLHNSISLNVLADLAYMAIPSFCRFFKSRMGLSPLQYISEERMERARKLLIELDKPVYEIAGLCGYNSDSHFCKLFKAHSGISPYQYRSKARSVLLTA